MSRLNLRRKPRVSYFEPDDPELDEYVYCDECSDYVYEYCAIHGPLLVIPDDKVPAVSAYPPIVPRAALTVPRVFLHLARSDIPDAGIGVFTTLTLPRGVRFGPYTGDVVKKATSDYCWQIYDANRRPLHMVDAGDPERSNWLRYINCARHNSEQNLVAYQYQGQLYCRTTKLIPRFTELLVFYGSEFAHSLGVSLKHYNKPLPFCAYIPDEPSAKKPKLDKIEPTTAEVPSVDQDQTSDEHSSAPTRIHTEAKNTKEAKKSKAVIKKKNSEKNIKLDKKKDLKNSAKTVTKDNIQKKKDLKNSAETINNDNIQKEVNIKVQIPKLDSPFSPNTQSVVDTASATETKSKCINNYNIDTSSITKILTCDICEYATSNKKTLNSHLKAHAATKRYSCNSCSYMTIHKSSLETHLKIHTGEKPYCCDVCKKKFARKNYLVEHERVHTGEKSYCCDVCKKKFARKKYLVEHERVHTGEKPYCCDVCKKKFARKNHLVQHERVHTGEKPYSCNVCEKKFTNKTNLVIHVRIHTGEKPYSCNVCQKKFNKKSNLVTHVRTHIR